MNFLEVVGVFTLVVLGALVFVVFLPMAIAWLTALHDTVKRLRGAVWHDENSLTKTCHHLETNAHFLARRLDGIENDPPKTRRK